MIRRAANNLAYTLLELVLVLALLALALAVAAPSLSGFGAGRRTEEAASSFVALARWARSQAAADGVAHQLFIDTASARWWVTADDSDAPDTSGFRDRTFTAPEGVQIQADAPVLEGLHVIGFDPSGRADMGRVWFVGTRNTMEVTCDSLVGEFHVVAEGGS